MAQDYRKIRDGEAIERYNRQDRGLFHFMAHSYRSSELSQLLSPQRQPRRL